MGYPESVEPHSLRMTPMNQSSLRSQNLRVVARALWAAGGGLSRAELAAATGLTRATVSRLVSELLLARLVSEGGPTDSGQPGRPGTPLHPAPATVAAVGIEINVDHAGVRVMDLAGTVLGERVIVEQFAASDPVGVLRDVGATVAELVADVRGERGMMDVCGASLAVPALVSGTRLIRLAPNLGWHDVEPFGLLGDAFAALDAPLLVENDANLQAIAASRLAPGRVIDQADFLYVGGDVGVGAALIEGGELRRGGRGWAGELGHVTVDPKGLECACGSRGCLERYAGRRAMYEAAGLKMTFGTHDLVERLRAGDQRAIKAMDSAADALSVAISSALNILDLSKVVLGTTLADISEWLVPLLRCRVPEHLVWSQLQNVEIDAAAPDEMPAATGGTYYMLERVVNNPGDWIIEQQERAAALAGLPV